MRVAWRWVVAGVAAAAAAARLARLADSPSAELGLAYAVARSWGEDPANVFPPYALQSALWWQRPLAFALAAPAAALGPTAFRVAVALVGSVLPPLVAWAVLRCGGRPLAAATAGFVAALHPTLVHAGTDAWAAGLASSLAVGALLAYRSDRPAAAGLLALAAAWSHPAGLAAPLALLAAAAVRAARRGEARLYPLELDRAATAGAAASLLGVLPSAAAWLFRGIGSGMASGADVAVLLAPFLLVVGALTADRAVAFRPVARVRLAPASVAVLALVLLVAAPSVPALSADRGDDLGGVLAALGPEPWDSVLLVDVDWRLVPHPFADGARLVGWSYTTVSIPLGEWVHAVEGSGHTVIAKEPRRLNEALRSAYAECVLHEDARYVVLDGACTPGHGDEFRALLG